MKKNLKQWLDWQEKLHPSEIDLGLERVYRVLCQLAPSIFISGNDLGSEATATTKQDLPFTLITVGGTNGKGSTIEFLHSILQQSGYRVGVYTSPHFLEYNERIQINHQMIADDELCACFEDIDYARNKLTPIPSLTYFEFGTLAAIDYFIKQQCDIVLLEVGLGGRLDAVNCLDADCSLITTVDLDHQDWLGDNIEKIGFEKAGIFRSDKIAIYGDNEIPLSVRQHAEKINAHLVQYDVDYHFSTVTNNRAENSEWSWHCPSLDTISSYCASDNRSNKLKVECFSHLPFPNMPGDIQLKNLSNALMVLLALQKELPNLSLQSIEKGIRLTHLQGRLQKVSDIPLCYVDVAHNPQAARELRNYLQNNAFNGKTWAIFSILKDKDANSVIEILADEIDRWFIYTLDSERAMEAANIKQLILPFYDPELMGESVVTCYNSFIESYQASLTDMSSCMDDEDLKQSRVIVFGSFLTATDALHYFKKTAINN